jgi:hypothetical protein
MNFKLKISLWHFGIAFILLFLFLSLNLRAQYDSAVQAYILYSTNCTDMSVHPEATKLKGDTIKLAFDLSDTTSIASAPATTWYAHDEPVQADTIFNSPELWDSNNSAKFNTQINSNGNRLIQLAMGVYATNYPEYNYPMSNIVVIQVAPRAIFQVIIIK